ncbi:hypothetical protein SAMN05660690_0889 [Geodermatophilus telluris]|uniref:Uncharacterized protein n=1 Tax=Geodermatophilus telluris TaxID=1190417 RepID=A0A1G6JM37_9ACTN|nr:hypothetical protein [Geodermatophilus telluris]SDC19822.1 hypothetical protein SAMN05660690_0889 [Geodermatophilus telluris]
MTRRRALVAVAAVQLAAGVAGQALALRRRRAFDTPLLAGDPARVGRDAWWAGTALGPPAWTLAVHGWALARLAARPDARAAAVLGWVGAALVPGYLQERLVRQRLASPAAEPAETAVVAVGLATAGAMAVLGAQASGARP